MSNLKVIEHSGVKATFAERLKYAMCKAGINQNTLAQKTNASKSAISQYLAGKNTPSPERIKALSDVLEVSVDFLIGFGHDPDFNLRLYLSDISTEALLDEIKRRCSK